MSSEMQQPSLLKIIQSDYLARLGVLGPIVCWVLYVDAAYFGILGRFFSRSRTTDNDPSFFLYLSLIVTVVGLGVLFWRIRGFRSTFTRGVPVLGRVTNVNFFRGRGTVEYTYNYNGQSYNGGNSISETGRTKLLRPGQELTLLVDPSNPKRAIIPDLYR